MDDQAPVPPPGPFPAKSLIQSLSMFPLSQKAQDLSSLLAAWYEAPCGPSPPSVARFPPELTAAGLEPTVLLMSGVQMRLTFS